jgi:pseudouridine synthase
LKARRRKRAPERDPASIRLQKILAEAGVASRREAERMIETGRVSVNGKVVTQLGTRAAPARDTIRVDGRRVGRPSRRVYYLVHKPRGYVTTTRDPHAKRTVLDLVSSRARLFPVGRLDAASEGLVLLTNDGELSQALLHPSFRVPRIYRVSVDGAVPESTLRQLAEGVEIEGGRTLPAKVRALTRERERSVLEIELVQGRRRQIREMMLAVGHPVRRLTRVGFGPLRLGGLRAGAARPLQADEVAALRRLAESAALTNRQPKGQDPDT